MKRLWRFVSKTVVGFCDWFDCLYGDAQAGVFLLIVGAVVMLALFAIKTLFGAFLVSVILGILIYAVGYDIVTWLWRSVTKETLGKVQKRLQPATKDGLLDISDVDLPINWQKLSGLRIVSDLDSLKDNPNHCQIKILAQIWQDEKMVEETVVKTWVIKRSKDLSTERQAKRQAELVCLELMAQAATNLHYLSSLLAEGVLAGVGYKSPRQVAADVKVYDFLDPNMQQQVIKDFDLDLYQANLDEIDQEFDNSTDAQADLDRLLGDDLTDKVSVES